MAPTRRYNPRPLLLAALAGPLAWSVQLVVNYFLTEVACKSGTLLSELGALPTAAWMMLAVTLLAALATLYGGLVAVRARRQLGEEAQAAGRARQRAAFMAQTGVYLSGIFLLLVLITGLPVVVLRLCG